MTESIRILTPEQAEEKFLAKNAPVSDSQLPERLSPEQLNATLVELASGVPVESFIAHGDSLTDSTGTDWPLLVGAALGIPAIDAGRGGRASGDVAVRAGALDLAITVAGGSIPASGEVAVSVSTVASLRKNTAGTYSWQGVLAGIPGTLAHALEDDTWTFTRTEAGEVVAVAADSQFHCTEYDANRSWIHSFWVGGNNFTKGSDPYDVVTDIDRMVRHVAAGGRYIALGPKGNSAQPRGSSDYVKIVQINTMLALRHGDRYLDIRSMLIEAGTALLGLTPTPQDRIDIANAVVPSSLRIDGTHLTADGYELVGEIVENKIRSLGYVIGKRPVLAPPVPTSLTVGITTSSSQELSWAASEGAAGYAVYRRIKGSAEWVPATNSIDPTAVVYGLLSGTDYEFTVRAFTIAGGSSHAEPVVAKTEESAGVVVTSDSFNRANADTLGACDAANGGTSLAWTSSAAETGIRDNKFARISAYATRYDYVDAGETDIIVEFVVPVSPAEAQSPGPLARFSSLNYWVGCQVGPDGSVQLLKRSSADPATTVTTAPAGSVVTGCRLALRAAGTAFTVLVNDVPVCAATITDATLQNGTKAGLRSYADVNARADDFVVRAL